MSLRKLVLSVSATAMVTAAALAAPAWGQQAPTYTVSSVQGDVLVLRGNQVFSLRANDTLQVGDQVFTRAAAQTVIQQLGTCSLPLAGASSVTIPSGGGAACNLTQQMITSLSSSTTIAGVTIGTGTVGAATTIIGALAAVGVGAAVSNGQSGSP